MNKAFYLFVAKLRGLDPSPLRKLTLPELQKMFKKIKNSEMQEYNKYINRMNKHPLMKLTVAELKELMDKRGLTYYGLSKIEIVEALDAYSSDEDYTSDSSEEIIEIVRKKVGRIGIRSKPSEEIVEIVRKKVDIQGKPSHRIGLF